MEISLLTLKLGLLGFWTLWYSLVLLTNLLDGLKVMGMLPEQWKLASQNYRAVEEATSVYQAPAWLPRLLFSGAILWQLLAAVLFGWAFWASLQAGSLARVPLDAAVTVGAALWAAFMLADEVFKQYDNQSQHLMLLIGQMATALSLYLLPA